MPTNSKWQIGLLLWLKALSRGLRLAAGGAGLKSVSLFSRSPSGDSKGRSPWRAFGDFPRDGKVTRVPSMAKPCSRGAPAGGCRGYQPRKSRRDAGRSAHIRVECREARPLASPRRAAATPPSVPDKAGCAGQTRRPPGRCPRLPGRSRRPDCLGRPAPGR